jgi:putative phosphoribosyl transferase
LDIILSRKLSAPDNPELAIGALTEEGRIFLNKRLVSQIGINERHLEDESKNQFLRMQRSTKLFRNVCSKISLRDKNVVLIDDGIATGLTIEAALWSVAQEKPHKIIGAFPVGSEESLQRLSTMADEIICLRVPPTLHSIGEFYLNFEDISEEGILKVLKDERMEK